MKQLEAAEEACVGLHGVLEGSGVAQMVVCRMARGMSDDDEAVEVSVQRFMVAIALAALEPGEDMRLENDMVRELVVKSGHRLRLPAQNVGTVPVGRGNFSAAAVNSRVYDGHGPHHRSWQAIVCM